MLEKDIKNHRIIIKDASNNQILADTEVLRYNSSVNSVVISSRNPLEKKFYQISAYIFAEKCLYKCGGTIREIARGNEIEVFLGKYETIEERHAVRYSLALEGSIEGICIDDKEKVFEKTMPVKTVNMSSTGILLSAVEGSFNIGGTYTLAVKTNIGLLKMKCEVVRIKNGCDGTAEYGCRIKNVQWDQKPGRPGH